MLPTAAFAQSVSYVKPPNVPTIFVQDYNVTISVWVIGSAVGSYIAEFELHPDGKWYFGDGDAQYSTHFDSDYAVYGPAGWIVSIGAPHINAILTSRFPQIGSGNSGGGTQPVDQVNNILATAFSLKMVNGLPALAPK